MKNIVATFCALTLFLVTAPMLCAQDYSHYRGFSLGASLATVLKQTDQKMADVTPRTVILRGFRK